MTFSLEPTPDQEISECPICSSDLLQVKQGRKWIFFRTFDSVTCNDCGCNFRMGLDRATGKFSTVPSPYSYFETFFKAWVDLEEARTLAQSIREGSSKALDYLTGARRYAWQVNMILGFQGQASPGKLRYNLWWNKPTSKEQAEKVLDEVSGYYAGVKEVIEQMTREMAELQPVEGQKRLTSAQNKVTLKPYEEALLGFNQLLLAFDRVKLLMRNEIDSLT